MKWTGSLKWARENRLILKSDLSWSERLCYHGNDTGRIPNDTFIHVYGLQRSAPESHDVDSSQMNLESIDSACLASLILTFWIQTWDLRTSLPCHSTWYVTCFGTCWTWLPTWLWTHCFFTWGLMILTWELLVLTLVLTWNTDLGLDLRTTSMDLAHFPVLTCYLTWNMLDHDSGLVSLDIGHCLWIPACLDCGLVGPDL